MTRGNEYYVKLCAEAVRELTRLQTTIPLQTAQFLVAFRQDARVWLIGFDEQTAAQDVYDAMLKNGSKVIAKRGDTKVGFWIHTLNLSNWVTASRNQRFGDRHKGVSRRNSALFPFGR